MDFSTLIGLIVGTGLMLWAILTQGDVNAFLDFPSVLIVGGGSLAAAMISFPIQNLVTIFNVVKNAFFRRSADPREVIRNMVAYAEIARRDGILSLEGVTKDVTDPFLVTGIQMAVDGTDPDVIEQVLLSELESVEQRHESGRSLFENLGKYAPAFGMVGTLIGLVVMLKNMSDVDKIGPAMAVALLTTLYGSLIANLVALPIADKLGIRSQQEVLIKSIIIRGVMAIQSGDNPRIVEQKLMTFLPHRLRFNYKDHQAA